VVLDLPLNARCFVTYLAGSPISGFPRPVLAPPTQPVTPDVTFPTSTINDMIAHMHKRNSPWRIAGPMLAVGFFIFSLAVAFWLWKNYW